MGDQSSRASELCDQCLKVDFQSLFSPDLQAFWLGKLSTVMQNDSCPFCRLTVHAIHSKLQGHGSSWVDRISWEAADRTLIDVWVKTTFWARFSKGYDWEGSIRRSDKFRYRPALGISWMPNRRRQWDRAKCLTICELDSILAEPHRYFTANREQDHSQVLRRRLIPAELDIGLIQAWIEECENHHGHPADETDLQSQLRATGQFRLYDVVQSRLIQPFDHAKYVALSYVWGNALRTRQAANPDGWWDEFFDGAEPCQAGEEERPICFSRLPVTIQDASLLLQRLGWRYLWVDLLCVNQTDQSQKQLLIDMMHIVYKGASITLIAAGGTDAESPLHGLRSGTRCSEDTWTIPTTRGNISLVLARPELPELLRHRPWSSRGWTFQEDILSSCCLYFTQEEVFYSCDYHMPLHLWSGSWELCAFRGFPYGRFSEWREGYVLESKKFRTAYSGISPWNEAWARSMSYGLRFSAAAEYQPNVTPRHWTFRDYASLVRKFSQRTFTNRGDVVSAFSGILSNFSEEQTLDANVKLHGLLRSGPGDRSFAKALLWIPGHASALRRCRAKSVSGTMKPHTFPSWSWSGWEGEVEYLIDDCIDKKHDGEPLWFFSPVRFEPKKRGLYMKDIFQWSIQDDDRVVAWLTGTTETRGETPEKPKIGRKVCFLTLFTYVAETTLTEDRGFISQLNETWTDRIFYRTSSKEDTKRRPVGILPDCGMLHEFGNYKLVCIGRGGDLSLFTSPEPASWRPPKPHYVVLLIEKIGGFYERRGLSVVSVSSFEWTQQWIDIV